MFATFQEAFSDLVFKRGVEFSENIASTDPVYIKYSDEESKLLKSIIYILGDNKNLLFDLESTMNTLASILAEHSYKQGLKDGIQLRQELGLAN